MRSQYIQHQWIFLLTDSRPQGKNHNSAAFAELGMDLFDKTENQAHRGWSDSLLWYLENWCHF